LKNIAAYAKGRLHFRTAGALGDELNGFAEKIRTENRANKGAVACNT
jgi:hypothetical protein